MDIQVKIVIHNLRIDNDHDSSDLCRSLVVFYRHKQILEYVYPYINI